MFTAFQQKLDVFSEALQGFARNGALRFWVSVFASLRPASAKPVMRVKNYHLRQCD
jgi:hypothetical protein